jgi:hypothetical protein
MLGMVTVPSWYLQIIIHFKAIGVKVFIPEPKAEYRRLAKGSKTFLLDCCLHIKAVAIDSRAVMIGSWNCWGTFVFFDSDFSVVIFEEEGTEREANDGNEWSVVDDLDRFMAEASDSGRFAQIDSVPEGLAVPLVYRIFGSRTSKRLMKRGF